jgi:hypothetical protein
MGSGMGSHYPSGRARFADIPESRPRRQETDVTHPGIQVGPPRTAADLDVARDLMRAFLAWHRRRHEDDGHLVAAYFDDAAFERELAEST